MKILAKERLSEHKYKDGNGYLICTDCILSRTGKQTYHRDEVFHDGSSEEIEVDRLEDEVFSNEALASFENTPICINHPDCDVNPENHNDLSVGFVRNVRRGTYEGNDVMIGDLVITDAKAIDLVESGEMCELSCGYDCDIQDEDNPQQRNIRGNHVALCEQGRAGIAKIIDSVEDKLSNNEFKKIYKYYEIRAVSHSVPRNFDSLDSVNDINYKEVERKNKANKWLKENGLYEEFINKGLYKQYSDYEYAKKMGMKDSINDYQEVYVIIKRKNPGQYLYWTGSNFSDDIDDAVGYKYKDDAYIEKERNALSGVEISISTHVKPFNVFDSETTNERNDIIEESNIEDKTEMTKYGKYYIVEMGDKFIINSSLGNYITKANSFEEAKRKIDLMDSVRDYRELESDDDNNLKPNEFLMTDYNTEYGVAVTLDELISRYGNQRVSDIIDWGSGIRNKYGNILRKIPGDVRIRELKKYLKDSVRDSKHSYEVTYIDRQTDSTFTTVVTTETEDEAINAVKNLYNPYRIVKVFALDSVKDIRLTHNNVIYNVEQSVIGNDGYEYNVIKKNGKYYIIEDYNEDEDGPYSTINEAVNMIYKMTKNSVKDYSHEDDNNLSKSKIKKVAHLVHSLNKDNFTKDRVASDNDLPFINKARKIYKVNNKNAMFVIQNISNTDAEGFASGDGGKTWYTAKTRVVTRKNSLDSRHQNERRFSSSNAHNPEIPFSHVVWCYHKQVPVIPNETIDHLDGNHLNDNLSNLEPVSNAENKRREREHMLKGKK